MVQLYLSLRKGQKPKKTTLKNKLPKLKSFDKLIRVEIRTLKIKQQVNYIKHNSFKN